MFSRAHTLTRGNHLGPRPSKCNEKRESRSGTQFRAFHSSFSLTNRVRHANSRDNVTQFLSIIDFSISRGRTDLFMTTCVKECKVKALKMMTNIMYEREEIGSFLL